MASTLVVGYVDYLLKRIDSSFALRSTLANIDLKIENMSHATLTKQLCMLNAYLQCHALEPTVDFMRSLLINQINVCMEAKRSKRSATEIESGNRRQASLPSTGRYAISLLHNEYYEGLLDKIWQAYERRHFKVKIANTKIVGKDIDNSQKIAAIIRQKLDHDPMALETAYKTFNEEEFKNDIRDFVDNISQDTRVVSPDLFCKKFRGFVSERRFCFAERVLKEEMIMDFDKKERNSDFFKMLGFHAVMSKLERNLMKKFLIKAEPDGQFELLRKYDTIKEVEDPDTHQMKTLYVPKSTHARSRAKKIKQEEVETLIRKYQRPISRYIRNLDEDKFSLKGHNSQTDISHCPSSPRNSIRKARESVRGSFLAPKLRLLPSYENIEQLPINPEKNAHRSNLRRISDVRSALKPSVSAQPLINHSTTQKNSKFWFGRDSKNDQKRASFVKSKHVKSKSGISIQEQGTSPTSRDKRALKYEVFNHQKDKTQFNFVLTPAENKLEIPKQAIPINQALNFDLPIESQSDRIPYNEKSNLDSVQSYEKPPVALKPAIKPRSSVKPRPRPTSSHAHFARNSQASIDNPMNDGPTIADHDLQLDQRTSIEHHYLAPPPRPSHAAIGLQSDASMLDDDRSSPLLLPLSVSSSPKRNMSSVARKSVKFPLSQTSNSSVAFSSLSIRIKRNIDTRQTYNQADMSKINTGRLKAKVQDLMKTCSKTHKQISRQKNRVFRTERMSRPMKPIIQNLKEVHQDYAAKDKIIKMIHRRVFKKKFVAYLTDQVKDTNAFFYSVQVNQLRNKLEEESKEREATKIHMKDLAKRDYLTRKIYSHIMRFQVTGDPKLTNSLAKFESRPSQRCSPMKSTKFQAFDNEIDS